MVDIAKTGLPCKQVMEYITHQENDGQSHCGEHDIPVDDIIPVTGTYEPGQQQQGDQTINEGVDFCKNVFVETQLNIQPEFSKQGNGDENNNGESEDQNAGFTVVFLQFKAHRKVYPFSGK